MKRPVSIAIVCVTCLCGVWLIVKAKSQAQLLNLTRQFVAAHEIEISNSAPSFLTQPPDYGLFSRDWLIAKGAKGAIVSGHRRWNYLQGLWDAEEVTLFFDRSLRVDSYNICNFNNIDEQSGIWTHPQNNDAFLSNRFQSMETAVPLPTTLGHSIVEFLRAEKPQLQGAVPYLYPIQKDFEWHRRVRRANQWVSSTWAAEVDGDRVKVRSIDTKSLEDRVMATVVNLTLQIVDSHLVVLRYQLETNIPPSLDPSL